ncbi:MAG: hypothetical protein IPN90_05430 [Elusimicrobia bacterium]|nr:hypothetical protein [Elusimicrobiota bacterium]
MNADLAILEDLSNQSISSISNNNATAMGALISSLRGFESVLDEQGIEADEKTREFLIQAINIVMSVLGELHERISSSQIDSELERMEQSFQNVSSSIIAKSERTSLQPLKSRVSESIRKGWKAESALYMEAQGVSESVLRAVLDELTAPPQEASEKSVVVFSNEVLTPNDLTRLERRGLHVVGLVSSKGNPGSHVAMVAQGRGIPYVTGAVVNGHSPANWAEIAPVGAIVGLNGGTGEIFVNPSLERFEDLKKRQEKYVVEEAVFDSEVDQETPIPVFGSPDDTDDLGRDPVGLIRTEYLFNHPSETPLVKGKPNKVFEDYLFEKFEIAARVLKGRQLDIRVIDNQGQDDKPLANVPQKVGGATGIEFLLRDPEGRMIALQEIRAIIRAYQNNRGIRMFFPLVSTLEDADGIAALVTEAFISLPQRDGFSWELPPVGYMIETPAGVMNARLFAKRAKFFSIGSTDLTRSTYNKARNDPSLARDLETVRPEFVRQVRTVLEAAHTEGIDVNLCGALASSRVFWPIAVALNQFHPLGLSVPPPSSAEVKYYLRRIANETGALERIRNLLDDENTTSAQLIEESQKLINKFENGIPNEPAYRQAMKKLQDKRAAELIRGVARLAFVVIFSGLFGFAAFGIGFSEAAGILGGIPAVGAAGLGTMGSGGIVGVSFPGRWDLAWTLLWNC